MNVNDKLNDPVILRAIINDTIAMVNGKQEIIDRQHALLIAANTERDDAKANAAKQHRADFKAVARYISILMDAYPKAEEFPVDALDLADHFGIQVLADPERFPDGDVYENSDDALTTCDAVECDGECNNNYCEARA